MIIYQFICQKYEIAKKTTQLCFAFFSALINWKSKYRNNNVTVLYPIPCCMVTNFSVILLIIYP